ncbi:hypothetical protein [Roseivirga pacifica]|uniref:hypothetical protein n=1 Tax=Roseivirga pacifica TaxID=1267423 RepID=UPI003BB16817
MPVNTTLQHEETKSAKDTYFRSPSEALALALRHLSNGNDNIHFQVALVEPETTPATSVNDILKRALSAFE